MSDPSATAPLRLAPAGRSAQGRSFLYPVSFFRLAMTLPLTMTLLLTMALLAATACNAGDAGASASDGPETSTPETAREPETAQEVVDRAIEHHGGDLYESTETELTITSRSGSFRVVSRVEGELFDHVVHTTGREGEERKMRATNDRVELWVDGEPVPVEPDREQRIRDTVMARVYFPFLPYRLNDPSVRKRDLGLETWDGRELRKIKVTFAAGTSTDAEDEYLYWFDPETGRLEQFAYSFHTGQGGLRLRRGFDYRRVGGILFMDSENLGVNGLEGPGGERLTVESITPAFAEEQMELISTVELSDVQVRPLE